MNLSPGDLIAKYKQLYSQATENLTVVQNRCTALLQEVSALKWLVTSDAIESRVLADVVHERRMQDQKWGPLTEKTCDKPDGTGANEDFPGYEGISIGWTLSTMRKKVDDEHGQSFMSILVEEVLEACSEIDQARLRKELVQVGAVVVKWIQAIDMRRARLEARDHTGTPGPGWWCDACGGFNGAIKEERRDCRSCGAKRPGFGIEQTETSST